MRERTDLTLTHTKGKMMLVDLIVKEKVRQCLCQLLGAAGVKCGLDGLDAADGDD